ncbi:MAG: AI-2E family transporter [Oscillospiraceae bacterium]|nr:AI-2E family transporter [Oscillospiraceae bacterium]
MNRSLKPPLWAFLALAAVILALKPGILFAFLRSMRPVFLGIAIAFLMNHLIIRLDLIFRRSFKSSCAPLTVAVGYVIMLCLVAGAVWLVIPNIVASVSELTGNIDYYYGNLLKYYAILESKDSLGILKVLTNFLGNLAENIPAIIEKTYSKTSELFSWLIDGVFGLVISIYILLGKTQFKKGVAAIASSLLSGEGFKRLCRYYSLVYNAFSRFIIGQITEAVILGSLCFIGMKLFRFEYAPLISFLIGITALIPVVGAIIGALPSAFLLFLNDPISAVWFLVFLIVLQQLENHLIYPRVVGKSIGLPPLIVIISIVIGAGLGGVIGIIITIPLMAALWEGLRINSELEA